jgi:hypothetical protein
MTRTLLSWQIRRKDRARLRGSTGRPVRVVNTRSVSGHAEPHVRPVGGLPFGLELESLSGDVEQWKVSAASVGLDRAEVQQGSSKALSHTSSRGMPACPGWLMFMAGNQAASPAGAVRVLASM